MTLRDQLNHPDRRPQPQPLPEERREAGDRRVPEWRRRALEQHDRLGFVAVTDLTRDAA